jgi:predicted nucleic acid-binding protein
MIKQRIYIDTSVIGGYFDEEFSAVTISFFDTVEKGNIILVVSDLLDAELMGAPDFVRNFFNNIDEKFKEKVRVTPEVKELANKYIEAKVVGPTSVADCQHIALATINKADVLISWNFKHIVNLDRIRGYNGINYQFGFNMIEIRTPKEILKYVSDE